MSPEEEARIRTILQDGGREYWLDDEVEDELVVALREAGARLVAPAPYVGPEIRTIAAVLVAGRRALFLDYEDALDIAAALVLAGVRILEAGE